MEPGDDHESGFRSRWPIGNTDHGCGVALLVNLLLGGGVMLMAHDGPWGCFAISAMGALCIGLLIISRHQDAGRERMRRANRCVHCGYDLRASPERCPECGNPREG